MHMRVLYTTLPTGLLGSFLALFGLATTTFAQTVSPLDFHALAISQDHQYRERSAAFEASVYRYMSGLAGSTPLAERAVLTIPVVVHVMHLPGDALPNDQTSNLTDQRIRQAIQYLNLAFRNAGPYAGGPQHTNAGILPADIGIEFCLAQVDPAGNPTSGILRTPTTYSNLHRDDPCPGGGGPQDICMKSLSHWDSRDYLNIWVVNEICAKAGQSCEINAYSYMPGAHGTLADGIVVEARYIGDDPGQTTELIHEAGHYLGLFDTYYQPQIAPDACTNDNCLAFGDGICDTPPDASRQAVDCAGGQRVNSCSSDADDTSANNPFDTDVEDMYENFMDDGGPVCRNTFTPMQRLRMRFALTTERQSLLNGPTCNVQFDNAGLGKWLKPPTYTCDSLIFPKIQVYNSGTEDIVSIDFWQKVDQLSPLTWTWTGVILPGDTLAMQLPAKFLGPGRHVWNLRIEGVNGAGPDDDDSDNLRSFNFVRLPAAAPVTTFPYCEDLENGLNEFGQVNWDNKVGFDNMPYNDCSGVTGKYVYRYNTNGLWENGAGLSASPQGTIDALYSRPIDLTEFNEASFSFVSAYKESYPDKALGLSVWVIPSCGASPEKIYSQSASDLESSQSPFNPGLQRWVPDGCSEWNQHNISLSAYTGQVIRLIVQVELEAEYSQNFYLDNLCVDARLVCGLPAAIPGTAGIFQADTACAAPDGWTHFWKYAQTSPQTTSDVLLFSVYRADSIGLGLDPDQVQMVVTAGHGQGGHDLSDAPYVQNKEGWYVAGRFWTLAPDVLPAGPARVRVYLNDQDMDDLRSRVAGMTTDTLPLTVFRMGTDPDPVQRHSSAAADRWTEFAAEALATGDRAWKLVPLDDYYALELNLSNWDGLGVGLSGEGKGVGPTYPPKVDIVEARQMLGSVEIRWDISRELMGKRYQVWRKGAEEPGFAAIGEILCTGNHWIPQTYSFLDNTPLEGAAEYHVTLDHQVPLTGFSDTVNVLFDAAKLVNAYPNPTAGKLNIRLETGLSEPVYGGLFNADWQLLQEQSWRHGPEQEIQFDLGTLPPGIYFYVVRFNRGGELQDVRGKIIRIPEG